MTLAIPIPVKKSHKKKPRHEYDKRGRKPIQDEFTRRRISRQRKYQLRKAKQGRCVLCGKPARRKPRGGPSLALSQGKSLTESEWFRFCARHAAEDRERAQGRDYAARWPLSKARRAGE